ncbi:MAG: zf-HC2 domain-containing protein [Zavarzinella sp.]
MNLTCKHVTQILIDFVDGTLEEDQTQIIQRHLCGCVPCAIYLKSYEETIRITHQLPDVPIPVEFEARLRMIYNESKSV